MVIRRLKREDAEDITRIYGAIIQADVKIDFRRVIEEQTSKTDDASFVAEYENRVVGYMISNTLMGGFGIEKSAWIAILGVDPKFMGEGIGKRLAEEIFGFYRDMGIEYVYTSVRWDSTDLLSFFKTLGFDRSNFINLRKALA